MFLLSDIGKFIDRSETKTTDVDPSIVGQHVRRLKNNYFKPCKPSFNHHQNVVFKLSLSLFREHRQKTFITLSGFWPLRGWSGVNPLKKKIRDENLFYR